MTEQIDDFWSESAVDEMAELTEKIGFVEGLDLITLKEKLRRHGVER